MFPSRSVLDLSIATALWCASQGKGKICNTLPFGLLTSKKQEEIKREGKEGKKRKGKERKGKEKRRRRKK